MASRAPRAPAGVMAWSASPQRMTGGVGVRASAKGTLWAANRVGSARGPADRVLQEPAAVGVSLRVRASELVGSGVVAKVGRPGMSDEVKAELWQRWRAGESISVIARALDKPTGSVYTAQEPVLLLQFPHTPLQFP